MILRHLESLAENPAPLADSLLTLTSRPDELERLAALSRARYMTFYESGLAAMRGMFAHPKLQAKPA